MNGGDAVRRGAPVVVLLTMVAALFLAGAGPAGAGTAEPDGEVTVSAVINGRSVEGATSNDPIPLVPDSQTTLTLEVTNDGTDTLEVGRVRLVGSTLGVTLITYNIPVPLDVPPGTTEEVDIPVVLFDLEQQATGLVPGEVQVFDSDGDMVASESFTLDVRGASTSVVGLFGIAILLATMLSILGLVRNIAARKLPPDRLRRGIRMGLTGVGIGLSFTLALAVFRVVAPEGMIWVPLVVVPALIGFFLGLASPGILSIEEDEIDRARETLARASAEIHMRDSIEKQVKARGTVMAGSDEEADLAPAHETVGPSVEADAADNDSGTARETVAVGASPPEDEADVRGTVISQGESDPAEADSD